MCAGGTYIFTRFLPFLNSKTGYPYYNSPKSKEDKGNNKYRILSYISAFLSQNCTQFPPLDKIGKVWYNKEKNKENKSNIMKVSYADVIINLDDVKIIRKALRPNNNGCWELVDVKRSEAR